MTEAYLQTIWSLKRINACDLQTVYGVSLNILQFGEHNKDLGGPDFLHGAIEIEGIKWHGHIEIHVKSSDWYKHGHQNDSRYDNVILHVVYEHDENIKQNGRELPTLELKNLIDTTHYKAFMDNQFKSSRFPCEELINDIDKIYLESMKSKALYSKLNSKVDSLKDPKLNSTELFYHLLAQAFGTSINKYGFERLSERVAYGDLRKLPVNKRYSLIISESGVYQSTNTNEVSLWQYKGTRPKNFPNKRIGQFARLISYLNIESLVMEENQDAMVKLFSEDVWDIFENAPVHFRLTKSFVNLLIINAVVPYLWYVAKVRQQSSKFQIAEDILVKLPPERNKVIKWWEQLKIPVTNAYDSQSLLALYRYYCNPKKCLSCEAGNKILNRIQ